ncbi:hypothetical protein EU805_02460 [Salipiger sp. IMCC34102]|uniref:hypothetical protein n=1 Tax=Salipiger sp. IMCC34102 TaxID=2510647 RepID=UPI00101CF62B|nr:hypothetical protein [Salipiger sp. IMCC34102]RYH04256.1 hypothetical protein EU805_02460 [Salipiger sp. IMCC34102]
MSTDMIFVLGLVLGVVSIPAIVSAFADGRTPRAPALIVVIAALMIGYAMREAPGAYSWSTLPDVLTRVVAQVTR